MLLILTSEQSRRSFAMRPGSRSAKPTMRLQLSSSRPGSVQGRDLKLQCRSRHLSASLTNPIKRPRQVQRCEGCPKLSVAPRCPKTRLDVLSGRKSIRWRPLMVQRRGRGRPETEVRLPRNCDWGRLELETPACGGRRPIDSTAHIECEDGEVRGINVSTYAVSCWRSPQRA